MNIYAHTPDILLKASYPYFVRNSAVEPAQNGEESTVKVRTWHGDTATKKPACYKDLREIFIESALNGLLWISNYNPCVGVQLTMFSAELYLFELPISKGPMIRLFRLSPPSYN